MQSASSTIGTLLTELRDEGTTLLRQEVSLAKAELSENISAAVRNSAGLIVGGAVAYAGAIVLLVGLGHLAHQGLVALGLSDSIAQWLGFVLVGAIVALIGWAMLAKARHALSGQSLAPRETLASLRDDQRWARNKLHSLRHEPAP